MTATAQPYQNDLDKEEQEADTSITPAAADPDEPRDEGAVESFGRAISEIVTGPVDDAQVDRRIGAGGTGGKR